MFRERKYVIYFKNLNMIITRLYVVDFFSRKCLHNNEGYYLNKNVFQNLYRHDSKKQDNVNSWRIISYVYRFQWWNHTQFLLRRTVICQNWRTKMFKMHSQPLFATLSTWFQKRFLCQNEQKIWHYFTEVTVESL